MQTGRIAFLGTARSGLGHVRRLATIAGRLRVLAPAVRPQLICNASPDGLSAADRGAFDGVTVRPRAAMAEALVAGGFDLAVLDTLQLPGLAAYGGPAVLILRETPADRLPGFHRDGGRPWDRVIVPNPAAHWLPEAGPGFSRSTEAAGWILRPTGPRRAGEASAGVVVATGGGGTPATRALLHPLLDRVVAAARARGGRRFRLRQALGPRSGGAALAAADETFAPGAGLNRVFRAADLVISTAGYNSVLELASTDTPALLVAIPRSLDDQAARVRAWGPKLGMGLDPDAPEAAADWLAAQIDRPCRRPPVDLGPDGATRAAQLVLEMLCPVS